MTGRELLRFFDDHGPRLHALLYRLTLRRDVAEDLLQDLFLRLSRSGDFAGARDHAAYARRTAINLALARRRKQRTILPLSDIATAPATPPVQALIDAEEVERILDAVLQLSDLSQQCFVMRYVEQDSYESIARRLGKTPHQTRGLCHAAVRQVREAVGATKVQQKQVSDA